MNRLKTRKQTRRHNPYAKEVRTPKYRQRVEPNKKKEYDRAKEKDELLRQEEEYDFSSYYDD
jgi:hypothetical protein